MSTSPESIRNDIKTLFLILNALNALATGLFPLSVGLVLALQYHEPMLALNGMAIGLPILGLATLGCFGAIRDNKNYLVTYSAINGLLSGLATLAVAGHVYNVYTSSPRKMDLFFIDVAAFNIFIALAAAALAVSLAKRAAADASSSAQRWLWSGLAFTVTYIVLIVFCMKFVI